jgi:CheY-like chemotaxis protein
MRGAESPALNGARVSRYIVVIEDEPAIQTLLRDVLECEGYSVLTIGHGGIAQELLRNRGADLILVDLMLPDIPGTQVCAWLRQHGHRHTPMIALSADNVGVAKAERTGLFQEAIRKPFDVDVLLDLIELYAGHRTASYA